MADNLNTTNLSRRNFAKGAAIIGALASIPAAAALAGTNDPDAELLELCRQHDEIQTQRSAWYKQNEAAYRRYCELEPKKPEALRVQKADRGLKLPVPWVYNPTLERRVPTEWYDCPDVAELERRPQRQPEAQARADEIIATYRAWDAECEAVMRSVGYDGTDDASDAFYEKLNPLDDAIIETPEKTLKGIRAKARAAAWYYDGADAFVNEDFSHEVTADQLQHSVMRDLLQLA
jgi:hypothetical protein